MERIFCVLALGLLSLSTAQATTVVFDNFLAPGDQFNQAGNLLGDAAGGYEQANFFIPSTSGTLLSVEAAIRLSYASGNQITLTLWEDNAGSPGSSSIASATLTGQAVAPPGSILLFNITSPVTLTAGLKYWVSLSGGNDTAFVWMDSLVSPSASEPYRQNSGAWLANDGTPGAFRVTVDPSPVPLPAAAWLMLSGLGGLMFVGRRRLTA